MNLLPIRVVVAPPLGDPLSAKLDKTANIAVAGLITKTGADLGTGLALTVAKATADETVLGTNDTKAVTPLGVKAAVDNTAALEANARTIAISSAITGEVVNRSAAIAIALDHEVGDRNAAITSAVAAEATARDAAIATAKTAEASAEEASTLSLGSVYISPRRWTSAFNAKVAAGYMRGLLANAALTTPAGLRTEIGAASTATATGSANGLMALADKAKLDGIAAGAQVNAVASVAGRTGAVTLAKADVGLSAVDNTADLAKPVSIATQTALTGEATARAAADTANAGAIAGEVTARSALIRTDTGSGAGTVFFVNSYGLVLAELTAAGLTAALFNGPAASAATAGSATTATLATTATTLAGWEGARFAIAGGTGRFVLENSYNVPLPFAADSADVAKGLAGIESVRFSLTEGAGRVVATNSYGIPLEEVSDAPANVDPLIGPDLWAIEGREQNLYLANLQSVRRDDRSVMLSIGSALPGKPVFARAGTDHVTIEAARMPGASAELTIRRLVGAETPKTQFRRRMLKLHRAPATIASGIVKVMLIGDSIFWRGMAHQIGQILADQYPGLTIVFIGTYLTALDGPGGASGSGPFAEARNGSDWDDLIYRKGSSADQQPVPAGLEASYFAGMLSGGKFGWNPFLVPETGPDSFNGRAFSFTHYLSTYGAMSASPWTNGRVETPDIVLIDHATNTITSFTDAPSTAVQRCREGRRIVTTSIRAAAPNCHIGVCVPAPARAAAADTRWAATAAVIADTVAWAENEAHADGRMWMVNVHAHQNAGDLGWALDGATPAAATGVLTAGIADDIHPGGTDAAQGTARTQAAEALSAFIASIVAGA